MSQFVDQTYSHPDRPLQPEELHRLARWRMSTFWVMLVGYIGYYLCRGNLSAAFPLLNQTFGYTNAELGLIALCSEVAYAVGKFVNGPLADRLGGRKIFLVGMGGAIVSNVAFGLSGSLIAFVIAWCVARYFLSMGWGGIVKTIGRWYPSERNGTVMGLISMNFQFGGVAATLFAGMLVALGVGWTGLFFYPAAALTLIWVWSYLSSRDHPGDVVPGATLESRNHHQRHVLQYRADREMTVSEIIIGLLKLPIFRRLLIFSFLTTLMRSIFLFWTPKFLVDIGMGNSNAIFNSAVFPFMGVLGTLWIGWYTDRRARNGDRARVMWMLLLGLAATLFAISQLITATGTLSQGTIVAIVVLLGIAGFLLLGPYSMSSGCLTLDIAGEKGAGSSSGLIDGIGYLGGALAAWGAGLLSDHLGWSEVFRLLGFCGLISAASAYGMSRGFQKLAAQRAAQQSATSLTATAAKEDTPQLPEIV